MNKAHDLEEVARTLHSAAIHLLRYVRTEDNSSGIGPGQLSALSVLVFGGPKSLHELAKAEQVQPPTMSRIVDALVTHGLAKREVDSNDRRLIRITATDKGIKVMHEGRMRRIKRFVDLLRPLPQRDLESLEKASEVLSRVLGTH